MDWSDNLELMAESEYSQEGLESFVKIELGSLQSRLGLKFGELCFLGELQLSFLGFLLLSDCEAMDQYRALLRLLSNADRLLTDHQAFSEVVLRILYNHISQCPKDFLITELTKNNFIVVAVLNIVEILENHPSLEIQRRLKFLNVSKVSLNQVNFIRILSSKLSECRFQKSRLYRKTTDRL